MLPKQNRLNLKKDFKEVASGKRLTLEDFKLMFKSGSNDHPQVGIALSTQQFRKSHLRNQARRKTSLAIEGVYKRLPNTLKLVIIPKASVLQKDPQDLADEILHVKDFFESN